MKNIWKSIANCILRYRIVLVVFILFITAIMGYLAKDLRPTYKFNPPLPTDHPVAKDYQDFLSHFSDEKRAIVFTFQSENIRKASVYRQYETLMKTLEEMPEIESILSIHNLQELSRQEEGMFRLAPLYSESLTSQQEVDSLFSALEQKFPFYKGRFFFPEQDTYIALIQVRSSVLDAVDREELITEIIDLSDAFEASTGIEIHKSGLPFIRIINSIKVKQEIGFFIALAMLVVGILIYVFLRSFRAVFFSLLVVAIGVIWSMGSMVLLGFDMTILTSMIPPLIIVIGIPNCVFLLNKYHYEFVEHGNKIRALSRVIQKVGKASFITNLTTAAGFGTFVLTGSQILVEFGIVAFINILLIYVISLIIIPSVYSGMEPPNAKHLRHLKRTWMLYIIDWMVETVKHRRKAVYFATALVVVFGVFGLSKIQKSGTLTDDIRKSDPLYKDMKFVENAFGGVLPYEILIDTRKKGKTLSGANLKRLDKLQERLKKIEGISLTTSVVDILKAGRQAYYNGLPSFYSLPSSLDRADILLGIKSLGSTASQAASGGFLDRDQQIYRVSGLIKDVGSEGMSAIRSEVEDILNELFPPEKYDAIQTGTAITYYEGAEYLVINLYESLSLAIVIIALIIVLMFGSFRMVWISILTNILPLLLTAGLMGYLGIVIKPSTVLVFSIAFGISIDDTIHFLAKFRQELSDMKWNLQKATLAAVRETGVSMFYTSIILFFGFCVFTASDFGGTVALGLLVSIALLVAMVANLLFLPTLLMAFGKREIKKTIFDPLVETIDEEYDIDLKELTLSKEKQPRGTDNL